MLILLAFIGVSVLATLVATRSWRKAIQCEAPWDQTVYYEGCLAFPVVSLIFAIGAVVQATLVM